VEPQSGSILRGCAETCASRGFRALRPATMKSAFTRIYDEDHWDGGSGRGSSVLNTAPYRSLVEDLIRKNEIRSVVDAGCGDWQSTHLIDWNGADSLGLDVVDTVIAANRERFGPAHKFECLDFSAQDLPAADLLLLKEVLQHWPSSTIVTFLKRLQKFKYVLITNSVNVYPTGPV
jgi:SAM-dependent methyltransferase